MKTATRAMFWMPLVLGSFLFFGLPIHAFQEESPAEKDPPVDQAEKEESPEAGESESSAGQEALDQATEIKLNANSLNDLTKVIDLCKQALEEGLGEGNTQFCNQLLASTQLQRGLLIADAVAKGPPKKGWKQLRQIALGDLKEAVEEMPEQGTAWYFIARLNLMPEGDKEAAEKAIDRAIDLTEDDPAAHGRALVVKATMIEDEAERRELLDQAVKQASESPEVYRARGAFLADQEQYDAALADLKKSLDMEPNHPPTLSMIVGILTRQERFEDALRTLELLENLQPGAVSPKLEKARILARMNEYDRAIEVLEKAHAKDPTNLAVLLLRATIYQQMDEQEKAIKDIDAVLRLKPDLDMALRLKLGFLIMAGKAEQALDLLEKMRQEAEDDTDILMQMASVHTEMGEEEKAIELLDQVLEKKPDLVEALRYRADLYLGLSKQEKAIADYEKILEISPEESGSLNNLAWVLSTSVDPEIRDGKRALELAKKAAELTDYEEAHILSTLAAAYAETGDFEKARRWSEKAVELGKKQNHEQIDSLKAELESYQQEKPWREDLSKDQEEKNPAPKESSETNDAADEKKQSPPPEKKESPDESGEK